jgi:hypothetical protein
MVAMRKVHANNVKTSYGNAIVSDELLCDKALADLCGEC